MRLFTDSSLCRTIWSMAKKRSRRERERLGVRPVSVTEEPEIVGGLEYLYPLSRITRDLMTSVLLFGFLMAGIVSLAVFKPWG